MLHAASPALRGLSLSFIFVYTYKNSAVKNPAKIFRGLRLGFRGGVSLKSHPLLQWQMQSKGCCHLLLLAAAACVAAYRCYLLLLDVLLQQALTAGESDGPIQLNMYGELCIISPNLLHGTSEISSLYKSPFSSSSCE
jgi:hypothetical protein